MTQQEKAVAILIRDGKWIPAYGFQNAHGLFIGHAGHVRIAEVGRAYPELVETDKTGKVYKYRFRFDNVHIAMVAYPEWKKFIREELISRGIPFKEFKTVFEDVVEKDGSHAVRQLRILE